MYSRSPKTNAATRDRTTDTANGRWPEWVAGPFVLPQTLTEFCSECGLVSEEAGSYPTEELTLESLILAQDERWRRA